MILTYLNIIFIFISFIYIIIITNYNTIRSLNYFFNLFITIDLVIHLFQLVYFSIIILLSFSFWGIVQLKNKLIVLFNKNNVKIMLIYLDMLFYLF